MSRNPNLSGNVRLVTSYSSNHHAFVAEATYLYKPFGGVLVVTSPSTDPRLKFAAQELDSCGLYHMGARYYDPALGRFLSRDPAGEGYAYAYDDPLSYLDPTGLAARQATLTYPVLPGAASPSWSAPPSPFQGLIDWWNGIPPFWRDVITIAAMVAITVATMGVGDVAVASLAVGAAIGAAAIWVASSEGTRDPQGLFDAFATRFSLGALGDCHHAGVTSIGRSVGGARRDAAKGAGAV